jgi:hypothetical protein
MPSCGLTSMSILLRLLARLERLIYEALLLR